MEQPWRTDSELTGKPDCKALHISIGLDVGTVRESHLYDTLSARDSELAPDLGRNAYPHLDARRFIIIYSKRHNDCRHVRIMTGMTTFFGTLRQ